MVQYRILLGQYRNNGLENNGPNAQLLAELSFTLFSIFKSAALFFSSSSAFFAATASADPVGLVFRGLAGGFAPRVVVGAL